MGGIFNSKVKYTLFLGIVAVAIIIACFFYIQSVSRALEEDNLILFDEIATETANSIGSKLGELLTSVRNYTYRFVGFENLSEEEQMAVLAETTNASVFHDMIYIDTEGVALSASFGETFLSRRDYFSIASDGMSNISTIIVDHFTSSRVNVFAAPVISMGQVEGVLAGVHDTEDLKDVIYTETFGGKASCYILNFDGTIVFRPRIDILELDPGISLFEVISPTSDTEQSIMADINSSQNSQGNFSFEFEEESYIASYKAIGFNEWVIVTVIRSSDILAFSNNVLTMTTTFAMIFMLIVIAGWLIWGVKYWISRRKHIKAVAERDNLKYVDLLTGGPSFEKFLFDVKEVFDNTPDDSGIYAMISMDINKFRTVNDHLGYEEGGKILNKLASLIQAGLMEGEFYTRRSADSFCILIKYVNDVDIFGRIETFINDTYYQIEEYKLILSFGVYKIDDFSMDVRSIIDRADLARKTIKGSNESASAFFDDNMLIKIREEKRIENIMEYALESNEFKVYLQPKYSLNDHSKVIGAEALVRWFRDGKMIPPGGFIPIFEKNGFITKIDKFVFEEVCKQQKLWMNRKFEMRTISVNMSRMNLQEPNFVRDLYEICNKYNVPTKYFEIEITESVAFENLDILTRVFNELKNYGFHISIDDFGTGYSSLNMLKNLPVDVLKIDRSFLSDAKNERANNIISHVISLALSLHMKTICEGIETIEQVDLLTELKCDMAQGFYFARPMPIEEYEKKVYGEVLAMT
ncbi:MAG: EAL domain-containing protein [Oscillospiraceae bacterium]|jgi:diguanylate cyclase (GGDEF)-like protein|nr:EAL domain-containing protein [Oscillospiraceae bacterium]